MDVVLLSLVVTGHVDVHVDWSAKPLVSRAVTAATIEVDCCEPMLTRDPAAHQDGYEKGNMKGFNSYMDALKTAGPDFVRFAPWMPYPRVVVMELTPPDCTATCPATNWNSTLFDEVLADFMLDVCGPDAVHGGPCLHSTAMQLAVPPSWLYVDGLDPAKIPADPWEENPWGEYNQGVNLTDETGEEMGAYFARVVEHYTAGGHHDSCGHWHPSGFHYNWTIVSLLNENDHDDGGPRYTRCFDATRDAVAKVNPNTTVQGPEVACGDSFCRGDYTAYFLDPKNHRDGRAPASVSHHWANSRSAGADGSGHEGFFPAIDGWLTHFVVPLVETRDRLAPKADLVVNEYIPFVNDWCNGSDASALFAKFPDLKADPASPETGCPDWRDPRATDVKINRATLGWSASAAFFAYGYGKLALLNYKYVGQDDLACGPWPDNEPAVTGMDWTTGDLNSKTFALDMLVRAFGSGEKNLLPAKLTSHANGPPKYPTGTVRPGYCSSTSAQPVGCNFTAKGSWPTGGWPAETLNACVAHATNAACINADFISFSKVNHDCSWYRDCNMDQLGHADRYETQLLREPAADADTDLFALPFELLQPRDGSGKGGGRGMLLVSKRHTPVEITLSAEALKGLRSSAADGAAGAAELSATVLEGTGPEPGFTPPVKRTVGADGKLSLGPYAVAIIEGL